MNPELEAPVANETALRAKGEFDVAAGILKCLLEGGHQKRGVYRYLVTLIERFQPGDVTGGAGWIAHKSFPEMISGLGNGMINFPPDRK